jgi:hypothetical protein
MPGKGREQAYSVRPRLPPTWVNVLARACIELHRDFCAEVEATYRSQETSWRRSSAGSPERAQLEARLAHAPATLVAMLRRGLSIKCHETPLTAPALRLNAPSDRPLVVVGIVGERVIGSARP